MRTSRTTKKPVIDHLTLPELEDASVESLRPQGDYECLRLSGGSLTELGLRGVTLRECELSSLESRRERWNVPVLRASRATLRDVEVLGSRIGALEIYDAEIRTTRFVGCKFDWINLRAAVLEDVIFEECTFGELDLSGATATRVAFIDSRADSVALAHTRLADVDLRGLEVGEISNLDGMKGATLDHAQVTALAATFAGHLGIRVED